MRAWVLLLSPLVLAVVVCAARVVGSQVAPAAAVPSPVVTLPITELVLYSNGIGHFRRAGDVEGKAKIELSATFAEMNDLLKSLTVEGSDNSALIYDSPATVEQALPTYAVDLSSNPSFGEFLQLARGEAAEVTLNTGSGEIVGPIMGMEERTEKADTKVELLNVWTDAGVRSIPLTQIRAVRFVNAKLDADVRRALSLIAGQRNGGRKNLRLALNGDSCRRVNVSYVAEAPVWKASYRLVSGADGAMRLQGWALVENTSAEDWQDVKVTLAGGRPVSFQMDLYPPLFAQRPIVEPAKFAALRPPTYAGPTSNIMLGFQGGGAGMQGGALGFAGNGVGGLGATNFGAAGGGLNLGGFQPNQQFLGGAQGGGNAYQPANRYKPLANASLAHVDEDSAPNRITDDDPLRIVSEASDAALGEAARYALPTQLSIPRLKSALVPFMDQAVTATPVSVYSPDVHATRALQAYRIKNTTGQPWVAGPISVARAEGYAGDARLSDWPKDEERLVAFALDSGCECQRVEKEEPYEIVGIKISGGVMEQTRQVPTRYRYAFKHHAGPNRVVWVEHDIADGWTLVQPTQADERTKNNLRFKVNLEAGKTSMLEVVMQKKTTSDFPLVGLSDDALRKLADLPAASPVVKQSLSELLALRERAYKNSQALLELRGTVTEASQEQARLRTNLERVPNGSDMQKELLEKLGRQEAAIEAARQKIIEKNAEDRSIQQELSTKTAKLTAG